MKKKKREKKKVVIEPECEGSFVHNEGLEK